MSSSRQCCPSMHQATSNGVSKGSDQLLTTVKKMLTHLGITGWQRSDESTDRNDSSFEDSDKLEHESKWIYYKNVCANVTCLVHGIILSPSGAIISRKFTLVVLDLCPSFGL